MVCLSAGKTGGYLIWGGKEVEKEELDLWESTNKGD